MMGGETGIYSGNGETSSSIETCRREREEEGWKEELAKTLSSLPYRPRFCA